MVEGEAVTATSMGSGGVGCLAGATGGTTTDSGACGEDNVIALRARASGLDPGTVALALSSDAERKELAAGSAALPAPVHVGAAENTGETAGAGELHGENRGDDAGSIGASPSAAGAFVSSVVESGPGVQLAAELSHRNASPCFCAESGVGVTLSGAVASD